MVDASAIVQAVQLAPYAAVTAVSLLIGFRAWNSIPAFMAQWLEFRKQRAIEKASDFTRLRDEVGRLYGQRARDRAEYDDFRKSQLAENEACRRELAEAKGRIAELEGYLLGAGKAAQDAAGIVAVERLAEKRREDK